MNFDLLAELAQPRTILDLGANQGHWHNQARLRWPNSKFTLVDGNKECLDDMRRTGAEHYIALLSSEPKELSFFTRKGSPACTGASIYRENTPFYEGDNAVENKVMATTLDIMFPDREFDLIKLDLQGAELDALAGGKRLVSKCKWIVMEFPVVEYNKGAPDAQQVTDFLLAIGFVPMCFLGNITHPLDPKLVIQMDVLFEHK